MNSDKNHREILAGYDFVAIKKVAIAMRAQLAMASVALLAACSVGSPKPVPPVLAPIQAEIQAKTAWTNTLGPVHFDLQVAQQEDMVVVASDNGTVAAIDIHSGRDLWRTEVGAPIAAGVGVGGDLAAVVTRTNVLVVVQRGRVLWRRGLSAEAYTAPMVAGGRVFVQTADRAVSAFDGATGKKLWSQQRPGEPLVLRQAGVMLAVADTVVVGTAGRLVGLNPDNGSVRWEVAIATPRGTNDVERLVDLVAPVSRVGTDVCGRAFQSAVGCVDAARGVLRWTRPSDGFVGLAGDATKVYGPEANGRVVAWRRTDGERAWTSDLLRLRSLSGPVLVGRSVAVADEGGLVHLLSLETGEPLARLTTDASGISATPVFASNTLVVVSHNGVVYGFQPG